MPSLIRFLKKYRQPTDGNKCILVERCYPLLIQHKLITIINQNLNNNNENNNNNNNNNNNIDNNNNNNNNLNLLVLAGIALGNSVEAENQYDILVSEANRLYDENINLDSNGIIED